MTTRTLFVGMDGATFTLLDELVNGGGGKPPVMPFLASIYREGVRCKLLSTPNPLTPPAWVSLMTGKNPGNHGIYDFIRTQTQGDDMFFTLYDARDCLAESIWSIAGRQGKRVAALNFPFTAPPPKDLNGIMIPGFIPWRHLRRNTRPGDFYDRLKSLPGFNPKELAWDFEQEKQAVNVLSDDERENWIRYHLPRENQWFKIAEYILVNEATDLMAVMFDGVDKLQHQAWVFLDPCLQTGESGAYHQRMRQLCLDYFSQLDGFIEKLVALAGPDVQLFMASDHGFTATHEVVRINTFLHQKGYLGWKHMPQNEETVRREDSMFANLDWPHTIAYCGTPSSNGINIRVARNPSETGIKPEEYESFREKLMDELAQLRDPVTNERIVARVLKREDVFAGPAMENAPDLLLVLRDSGFVSIRNKEPVVEPRAEIAGTHHPEGVFFACGRGIKHGELLDSRHITDVGATLLYSLGLEVPEDFDGRVPESVFTSQYLDENPIRIGAATTSENKVDESDNMTEDEKEKLVTQLKMLGYL